MFMEWTRVQIDTTNYGAELVTAVLLENNIVGAEIVNPAERVRYLTEMAGLWDYADEGLMVAEGEAVRVVFYVTADAAGDGILASVREGLDGLRGEAGVGSLEILSENADDETWLNEWKKHFKPLRLGRVVVVPEWESYTPRRGSALSFGEACCDFGTAQDEIVFTIDPGSAFGTGQHQTTQLCISALQKFMRGGESVLDAGCGSGILSVIALLLGAERVLACDIDPAGAIAATKKNAALNPVDLNRLEVYAGDALSDEPLREKILAQKYDIVVANIVADVIIELAPFVKTVLKPEGIFIASGIINERAGEVVDVFAKSGFDILQNLSMDGWHVVVGCV
jgi:ribosomal protein L11 methyltransferase